MISRSPKEKTACLEKMVIPLARSNSCVSKNASLLSTTCSQIMSFFRHLHEPKFLLLLFSSSFTCFFCFFLFFLSFFLFSYSVLFAIFYYSIPFSSGQRQKHIQKTGTCAPAFLCMQYKEDVIVNYILQDSVILHFSCIMELCPFTNIHCMVSDPLQIFCDHQKIHHFVLISLNSS